MPQFIATNWWALSLFGLFIGVFAGLFGLGGGAVLVPVMVLAFDFTQRGAQGTSLAVILSPSAAPAIWRYHQAGNVDWWFVLKVMPFMLVGSYFGAWIANWLPQGLMRMLFAFVLIYVAGYMVFAGMGSPARSAAYAMLPAIVTVILAAALGVFSRAVEPAAQDSPDPATPQADAAEAGDAPGRAE